MTPINDLPEFRQYVIAKTDGSHNLNADDHPFVIKALLCALADGDVEASEWLIEVARPKSDVSSDYDWVIDLARAVIAQWKPLELKYGNGALLDLTRIDARAGYAPIKEKRRFAAMSCRESEGMERVQQIRDFRLSP